MDDRRAALASRRARSRSARSAKQLTTFEILSIRSGFGLPVLLVLVALRADLRKELAFKRMGLHLARNSIHFCGTYTWTLAVTLLPFATVFALEFTMPVWVALLAMPLLGERMTKSRAGSIVLGFLGVLVIVRPGLASFQPAALLVLGAAFAFAISLIQTKMLTAYASTFAIIFWMNCMQLPMALAGSDPLFLTQARRRSRSCPPWRSALAGLTVALLPHQRVPRRRRHRRGSARLPAHSADRAGRLAVLRRRRRRLRVRRRRPDHLRRAVEPACRIAARPPTGLGPEKAAIADA